MRLLLDTHVLIGLSKGHLKRVYPRIAAALERGDHDISLSVVSLWEIAIKTRLGKLDPGMPPANLAVFFAASGFAILPITQHHVVAEVAPEPATCDPFDRLLLGQCRTERRLPVTVNHALCDHPLAAPLPLSGGHGATKSENPPRPAPDASRASRDAGAIRASRSAA